MDVTAQTFYHYLPGILDDLASSCFVSIDFEFSGIANGLGKTQSKKSTLQERYDEVKRSADKYQILQVGLTIAIEGPERAMYTLKPYNIYLSPIIDRRLDLERNVSFQSSAMQFLLENHFSMDTLYTSGVVYLSRDEEEQILENAAARRDRSAVHTSLDVEETETESIAFLAEVRRLVDDWLALHDARGEYLNIPPPSPPTASKQSKSMPSELNRFQKRLVHQLIEVEYPSLVTVSKPTFIQIIIYDEKREEAVRNQKMQWVQDRIRRQTGFRWIAEALVGGDLTNLEPFLSVSEGMPKSRLAQKEFLDRAKLLLQYNRPVLVGHNLFTDLIYFYRCFFGPLPDRVEHFQYIVHRLFPVLIDTKYMATHDCGSINPRSSLQETNDSLAKAAYPLIVVHEQHSKYDKEGISHEAGYDSLLTARVFIKLSAQLRDVKVSGATATDTDSQREPSSREPQPVAEGTLPRPRQSKKILMFGKIPVTKPLETVEDDSHYPSALEAHMMLGRDKCAARQRIVDQGHLIPRLGTEFWEVYGNKLRVFGTDERVCRIG